MTSCEEIRLSLGAHALNALEPEEAAEVDGHLAGCDRCLEEFTGLAELPALLGRVAEEEIELAAGPPRRVLDRLLATRARRDLRARRGRLLLAIAAATALLAGGGAMWESAQHPAQRGAAPTAVNDRNEAAPLAGNAEPQTLSRSYGAEAGGVSVSVLAVPAGEGSRLRVTVTGVAAGVECRLVVLSEDGTERKTALWKTEYRGPSAAFERLSEVPVAKIAGFRLEDAAGVPLSRIPPPTK